MLVLPNSQGMSVIPVLTEMTHLFGALQDPSSLTATGVAMDVMVGPSLLGSEGGGGGAPIQEGPPLVFLAGVLSVCTWCCLLFMWLLLLLFLSLNSKRSFLGGRGHTLTTLIVHRPAVH
jgi:hypothetical protein